LLAAAESNAMAASLDRLTVETDDMKRESGGEASPVSQGRNDVAALLIEDTDVTDDMKTESETAVEPVVTDDMKNEENESLETDEQKSRMWW